VAAQLAASQEGLRPVSKQEWPMPRFQSLSTFAIVNSSLATCSYIGDVDLLLDMLL
jgi:hypothetical protein